MLDYRAQLGGARVVITGAAGIFGSWLAEAFATAGADLLLTDNRPDDLATLATQFGARTVVADLSTDAGLAAVADAMAPAPDVLINNAGLYPRTPIADTTPA